jgi:hypothetical protein
MKLGYEAKLLEVTQKIDEGVKAVEYYNDKT